MEKEKYIYGLDLSLSDTGVAIFNKKGELIKLTSIPTTVTYKTGIKNNPNWKNKNMILGIRLKHIYDTYSKLREEYPPEKVIIERGFNKYNNSSQASFRVHGITNLAFADVENIYYPPKSVKGAITGKGNASKAKVASVLSERFGYKFANDDESDSVAVGLTYFIEEGLIEWK